MTQTGEAAYTQRDVVIPSRTPGWNLHAWLFEPTARSSAPRPAVVMAHGLGAHKRMALAPYARAFAQRGCVTLVFDYRRWGQSDGAPRNVLYVTEQLEDYRTALAWARAQPGVDPARVVVWGTSFAGGHAISLAAEARLGLAGAIAQCPYGGAPPVRWTPALLLTIAWGLLDYVRQAFGAAPVYVPTVADPGGVGVMTVPGWKADMFALADEPRDYSNLISASSMFEVPLYDPSAGAARTACPLLLVPPRADALCPPDRVDAIRTAARVGLVRVCAVPGDHFVVYPGQPQFEVSLAAQLEFLEEVVGLDAPTQ